MASRYGPAHEAARRRTIDEYKRQAKYAGATAESYRRDGLPDVADHYEALCRSCLREVERHRKS